MRRNPVLTSVISLLFLLGSATPASAAVSVSVRGMSHFHPIDSSFSWVGVRIKATPGSDVTAELEGPGVMSDDIVTCHASADHDGKLLAVWKINSAGRYQVFVSAEKNSSTDSATRSYTVPPPPPGGEKMGPFRFKKRAGCFQGWPRR